MVRNLEQYERALTLRKQGMSYNEILQLIPVSKSTLSLWLHPVGLSKLARNLLAEKKQKASISGGIARHNERVRLQQEIYENCKTDIGVLSNRERWLIGVALYWAEGSKEKEERPGSGVKFANSDPLMVSVFVRWLRYSAGVCESDIAYDLYVHEEAKSRRDEILAHWSGVEDLKDITFGRVYFKKGNPATLRKNRGNAYYGLVRVRVRASSRLTRMLAGWALAIGSGH